jgi:hypothetical protein
MTTSKAPQHEPAPASLRVQELLGGPPRSASRPTQHWNLGANYYLARGQPPPLAGGLGDPIADHYPVAGLPLECALPEVAANDRKSHCRPLEYCADAHCPPDTVPLWQGAQLMCAGPGAAKPDA